MVITGCGTILEARDATGCAMEDLDGGGEACGADCDTGRPEVGRCLSKDGAGDATGETTGATAGATTRAGAYAEDGSNLDGRPPGPPGRTSLPLLIGFLALSLPRGVGRETEFGGSPGPV